MAEWEIVHRHFLAVEKDESGIRSLRPLLRSSSELADKILVMSFAHRMNIARPYSFVSKSRVLHIERV